MPNSTTGGYCGCCDEYYPAGTKIVFRNGWWIIATHAPGGDDT